MSYLTGMVDEERVAISLIINYPYPDNVAYAYESILKAYIYWIRWPLGFGDGYVLNIVIYLFCATDCY